MTQIKEQIERGEYTVDPGAVAAAVLARLYELAGARSEAAVSQARGRSGEDPGQMECSYPDRPSGASRKWMLALPLRTRPIQVRAVPPSASSLSASARALGGRHTHSS